MQTKDVLTKIAKHPPETFLILTTDGGQVERSVLAGATLVVPQGLWHKPTAPGGAKFIYMTPGQSLHSDAADPRSESV